jgi:hypothetical protein
MKAADARVAISAGYGWSRSYHTGQILGGVVAEQDPIRSRSRERERRS